MNYDRAPSRDWSRLKSLPFSNRVRNVLANADCWNEFDIVEKMTKQKLADEPNSGPATIREVEDVLASLGLTLVDEETSDDRLAWLRKREAELVGQLERIRREINGLTGHE